MIEMYKVIVNTSVQFIVYGNSILLFLSELVNIL